MKVAIGYKIQNGPWGGGNAFVKSLSEFLKKKGHDVVYDLNDNDIDIILIIDPRSNHPNVTFTPAAIIRYLLFKNSNAIVIHRINECDQRKNTKTMNFRLRIANFCSDHTVLVGSWLTFQQLLEHMWYVVRALSPATVEMLTETVAVSDFMVLECAKTS